MQLKNFLKKMKKNEKKKNFFSKYIKNEKEKKEFEEYIIYRRVFEKIEKNFQKIMLNNKEIINKINLNNIIKEYLILNNDMERNENEYIKFIKNLEIKETKKKV
jgi:hypothetical protein